MDLWIPRGKHPTEDTFFCEGKNIFGGNKVHKQEFVFSYYQTL